MTESIAVAARQVASAGTTIDAVNPSDGPPSIEGHYDESIAAAAMLKILREDDSADGYIIACFGDPGLAAAREAVSAPVLGIAECAMRAASFIADGFSVVTTLARTVPISEHLVRAYGMENYCRKIRATDLAVLELEGDSAAVHRRIEEECRLAITDDGANAIVLGCAGMADLAASLNGKLGVPVIDGVACAVKFLEALSGLRLTTSKRGGFAFPLAKLYGGIFAPLSPSGKSE